MVRSAALAVIFSLHILAVHSQERLEVTVKVDLQNVDKDRVKVWVYPASGQPNNAVYNMPKIVPGTYSISDFGRFVDDFTAWDINGKAMEVIRLDTNRWSIPNAVQLDHITYWINDTFDATSSGIFEPGGTNIEEGKNYLLNMFGFAGYMDLDKHKPHRLEVLKPDGFYGATSLNRLGSTNGTDAYHAGNYFELHDNPIMYSIPDTASTRVANAIIEISTYSPKGILNSKEVLDAIKDVFVASAEYLGGELPVTRYTILIYLQGSFTGGFGALEHNTSTVFVMPEMGLSSLAQTFRDVAAHEFFHIVTPLGIHSEHIHDYDFVNPQMSRHLWLYEGCTEYAAQHVQVKHGLFTTEAFLDVMRQKIITASSFKADVPFTDISLGALDTYKRQYPNVYQQGALICMCLDLKLRHLSDGKYGTQELMKALTEAYGPDRPFADTALFAEISRISGFPQIKLWLERHVGGTDPLPYDTLLGYAGISYSRELSEMGISAGNIGIGYNPRRERVVIIGTDRMDEFGRSMGFKDGDELISWNGKAMNMENMRDVLEDFKEKTRPGSKVLVEINRKDAGGNYKKMKLKGKAIAVERKKSHAMRAIDNPTPPQVAIRKGWIAH